MTVVDDPSAAQQDAAAHVDPATAQALFEEARRLRRRRYRRRMAFAVFGGLIVIVFAALVVPSLRTPGTPLANGQKQPTTSAPSYPIPPELVVWKNFDIEVISSTSGLLIRTLATGVGLFRGVPRPSVSPSGIVYFDRGVEPTPNVPVQQVVSVPLQGGPLTVVAIGHQPTVSPNGRLLAYLADTDFSDGPEAIEVRNLTTGATTTWQYPNAGPDISGLTWTPDSRSLAFTATTPTPDKTGATLGSSVLDVSTPSSSLEAAKPIPLSQCPSPPPWDFPGAPRTMAWAGYLSATEGIGVCRRGSPLTGQSYKIELNVVAVATGRVIAHLPAISAQLDVGSVLDGSEGEVQVDAVGRHLAIVEVGTGIGTLYRWSLGNDLLPISGSPVRVTSGALSPAWVPMG